MKRVVLSFVLAASFACAGAKPPNLTPAANTAWYEIQVVRGADLLENIATDGVRNKVVTEDAARQVVVWHRSLLVVLQTHPANWQQAALSSLDELGKNLKGDKAALLTYIALVKTLIKEVQ